MILDYFYTNVQTATYLGISRMHLWRLRKDGIIQGETVNGIILLHKEEVEALKQERIAALVSKCYGATLQKNERV